MKLTAQRKFYLGALLVAAAAFAADRCFFSPPSGGANSQRPATPPAPQAGRKPTTATNIDQGEALPDLSGLSSRLQETADAAHLSESEARDGFRPPAQWIERAAKGRKAFPSALEQFRNQHRLMAVMTGGQTAWAIIDGKTLGIGQSIGAFRLAQVREHSVIFESADARVGLLLGK